MRYNNPITQQAARLISVVCSLLFLTFAVIYLLHQQVPLLAHVLHSYENASEFHPYMATAVILVIVLLPAVFLSRFMDFPIRRKAFLWAPSAIILAWLTDLSISTGAGQHQETTPFIYIGALALVALLLAWLRHTPDSRETSGTLSALLLPNLIILLVLFVFIVSVANLNVADHQAVLQGNG